MESWFSNDGDDKKDISFDKYPKLKSILSKAQKELKQKYKTLPGYKESKKYCKEEWDDTLSMDFPSITIDSHDGAILMMGWNQDGITSEYENSLVKFMDRYINEINTEYSNLNVYSDPSDTYLIIYIE